MRLNKVAWPVLVMGLCAPMMLDCAAAKEAAEAAQGCDEFSGGVSAVGSLSIDANAKAFVSAAADLQALATSMTADVKTACGNIATGLGATDTWTAQSGDAGVTAACDAAKAQITATLATLNADAGASVSLALTISGGQCSVAADAQLTCEGSCTATGTCDPGTVTARCDPGQLSGSCSGNCKASATCEGSATVAATCKGTCSATCTGKCSGACEGTITGGCTGTCEGKCDGVATPAGGQANCAGTCEGKCSAPAATATCTGKCAVSCDGTCSGDCKLDATANINCGASVSCKGGCDVAYTAPKCEVALTPPSCNIDANCEASCSGSAQLKATCTPPALTVSVVGSASASASFTTLKTVLEAELPKLILVAKTKGTLAVDGAAKVASTGGAVLSGVTSMGGKALACVTVAGKAAITASASVSVNVNASASVSGSAGAS